MKKIIAVLFCFTILAFAANGFAYKKSGVQTKEERPTPVASTQSGKHLAVAVYKVSTNGFSLNGSEVNEINRIALQACFDAGLKCSGRNETADSVEKEQSYGKRGHIAQSEYVAEFTLVGSTSESLKLGIPGGINIGGGYGKSIGGVILGGGVYTDLSGIGIKLSKMTLTGQITNTSDGSLAYSSTRDKMGLQGSFIIGEATSSNAKKLLTTFREIFEEFKNRESGGSAN